jgi:signal transduction histidine kinase
VVHFYHDITERTRLQGELIQSEKMAALGNLASHVAHELNNPLTGLLGLAQVIQAETQDSQLKDDMSEVVSAVERSQKIISNLVEFSNRNSDLKKAELNWYELVNRTLTFLKSSLRNCSVDLALVESSPTFKCESQLMQQVIFNILQNSIQAMDKPGVIKIYDQIDGNFSRLVIEDNGPGIPNTLQGRIFDSFFTTKSDSGGTGLGLSLCKQILEMHGGRIFYDGEYKLGARFVLELPNGAK